MSSVLKKTGHATKIVDACSYPEVEKVVKEWRPQIFAYTIRTGFHQEYLELNRVLKSHWGGFSVFGGPHATFSPQIIESDPNVDAVCIGEGELALADFVNRMEEQKDYRFCPNFWIRTGGEIYRNLVRPLVEDIDSLSFPDRDLLTPYPGVAKAPIKNFITSRGCPFNCSYCFNKNYREIYQQQGFLVRRRSVNNTIQEIAAELAKRPFELAHFEDDVFNLNLDWLENFSDQYRKEIGLPFSCHLRANLVSAKAVSYLKRAGCISAAIAIETGNDYLRNGVLNRNMSREEILRATRMIKEQGIGLVTLNMVAIPGGSLEADLETLDLNLQSRPDCAIASFCQPYPGTELGQKAMAEGLFDGNYDGIKGFYHHPLGVGDPRYSRRLQGLFPLLVNFRIGKKWARFFLRIPLERISGILSTIFIGYVVRFKIMPYRFRFRQSFRDLCRYLGFPDLFSGADKRNRIISHFGEEIGIGKKNV